MNTVTELCEAKERLADPAHWNRNGSFATDAQGVACDPDAPDAVAWCAVGAIVAAIGVDCDLSALPAVQAFCEAANVSDHAPDTMEAWLNVAIWSDDLATHESLIDTFDRAIALASDREPVAA